MLAAWGETGQVYAALNLGLDFLFLISYSLAIGLACVLLARRIAGRHAWLSQAGIMLAWGQVAELARQSLVQFTEYLHEGKYDEAARLYGGTYEVMISHNEDVDPEDRIALWRRACTINGAQCLRVRSATVQEQISPTEYVFLVGFEYDDGTLFFRDLAAARMRPNSRRGRNSRIGWRDSRGTTSSFWTCQSIYPEAETSMDLPDPRILELTVVIASLMFAVVAFSRGRPRGALAAAAPVVPLVTFYDSIGARRGWWHYPSVEGGATPIAWYIAGALVQLLMYWIAGSPPSDRLARTALPEPNLQS